LRQSGLLLLGGNDDQATWICVRGKCCGWSFAWNLIKTLQSTGSLTPGAQIWSVVRKDVAREYPQQPQYGAAVSAGHAEGGDFLFQTPK